MYLNYFSLHFENSIDMTKFREFNFRDGRLYIIQSNEIAPLTLRVEECDRAGINSSTPPYLIPHPVRLFIDAVNKRIK